MSEVTTGGRLDRPVDAAYDHVLGPAAAEITLVEYGSYDCSHCRAANEQLGLVRQRFGQRLRYVFRHLPLRDSVIARRAAELAERAPDAKRFWDAHTKLMTRSESLTEDDLRAVASDLGLTPDVDAGSGEARGAAIAARPGAGEPRAEAADTRAEAEDAARQEPEGAREAPGGAPEEAEDAARRARTRVEADTDSARTSGVLFTPTFFINGRRYDGPWDELSLTDAMLGSVGYRVRTAALDFAGWAPSTGVLLLVASVVAVALTNSDLGPSFEAFWQQPWGVTFGGPGFHMSLRSWINDALLTVFFLVVGLEIKREFTVGHLSTRRAAALSVAGAIGGMAVPAALYALLIPAGPWAHGWGVPMATDTAFAVALLAMLGRRVPVALRIFLTAAAIVDDIGAITVVAIFYSGELQPGYLAAAAAITALLAVLNRSRVYRATPYLLLGIALWACIHAGGLHATLAGVTLAMFIPTRPPPNFRSLMLQANTIINSEARSGDEAQRGEPSIDALRMLDRIHDRIESPADRMLRQVAPRSSYLVLPLFALANAGVAWNLDLLAGHEALMAAIALGLLVGKPLGLVLACALAVRLGLAVKPTDYTWKQMAGAGALAGIGFTMSLFIAGQAFPGPAAFAAAKVAVFGASLLSAVIGVAILWSAGRPRAQA